MAAYFGLIMEFRTQLLSEVAEINVNKYWARLLTGGGELVNKGLCYQVANLESENIVVV